MLCGILAPQSLLSQVTTISDVNKSCINFTRVYAEIHPPPTPLYSIKEKSEEKENVTKPKKGARKRQVRHSVPRILSQSEGDDPFLFGVLRHLLGLGQGGVLAVLPHLKNKKS
jgi:hypothetical protein